jgi:Ca-activated chloride channel homolog
MLGWRFSEYTPGDGESIFDRLLKLLQELLLYTSGDVREALSWLTELDRQYGLTNDEYGMADFIQDLMDKGYIEDGETAGRPGFVPTSKMEIALRRKALDDVFGQLKKTKQGNHSTKYDGRGDELASELRPYEFGDALDSIAVSESLRNAHINHGIDDFKLTPEDLEVQETFYQSQTSTVLMIDISHSMILYGEDRITPAKRVAMALSELITTRYPKDTLDILVFGNDAWPIDIKDLPYQYGGGPGTGDGYAEKTPQSEQTDFHDHGRKAYLHQKREKILQEQLRSRSHHRHPHPEPGNEMPENEHPHHHFYDSP